MTYAVTGATGGFGSSAISHLIRLGVQPSKIVAFVRSKEKAADLETQGVVVRIGNYNDRSSLERAFSGVSKVLLVSGSEVGQRYDQHRNVIEAAKQAGLEQIVYTSLTRADMSMNPLAPEHKATEEALSSSGLEYVILRNNWYTENFLEDVKYAGQSGMLATATGNARVASALRDEYAEAAARVLTGGEHANKTYELSGDVWTFEKLASTVSDIYKHPVEYKFISPEERKQNLIQAGMDEGTAAFFTALDISISEGSLDINSKDLERLLERAPLSLEGGLRTLLK